MNQIKKWLFPALTCLIVLVAVVLPARVSQAQDARQFGQVHTEALDADAVPVRDMPTLLERIELYACQSVAEHPVLSFSTTLSFGDPIRDEIIERAKDVLTTSRILPSWYFTDESFEDFTGAIVSHTLLWDPADGASRQDPSAFWSVTFEYHNKPGTRYKNLTVVIDDESGLPISLHMSDTNMAQWLPDQMDTLQEFAERFFDTLGLEVQCQYSNDPGSDSLALDYFIADTGIGYMVEHNATALGIGPYLTIGAKGETMTASAFDG